MRRLFISLAAGLAVSACGSQGPTEAEQDLDERSEHPAVLADAGPGQPQVREGPVTPAERNNIAEAVRSGQPAAGQPQPDSSAASAAAVVEQFGNLLEQKRFAEARQLYADNGAAAGLSDDAFADRFADFETIAAEVEYPQRVEGAAGSLYADVQLTIHGELDSGEPYSRTGTVTVRRSNDVPGATAEQLQWRIVNVRLGVAPGSAAAR